MSTTMKTELIREALEASQTTAIGFVGFTILVWDHAVTFADEVDIIWSGPKSLLACLFLLNRYLTPIGFIVNLVAYSLPSWSFAKYDITWKNGLSFMTAKLRRCEHFVRYEGAMSIIGIVTVALMMFLRVRAMYHNNRYAVGFMAAFLFAWVAVGAWLLCHGEAVRYSSYIHSCRMELSVSVMGLASAWAWFPLSYDTIVFALTVFRTLPSIRNKEAGCVVRTLLADGILFYSVICAINLIFTIMIVRAPQGLKNITGQLELILTVTMMSRITLSLKKEGLRSPTLNRQSESIFPVYFGCQTSLLGSLRPHPPAPSSPWRNRKVLSRPQRLVHSRVRTMKVVGTGRHQFQEGSMELMHIKDLYKGVQQEVY